MSDELIKKYENVREGTEVKTTTQDVPEGLVYSAPEGAANIVMPNGAIYLPDTPTKETDNLLNWERQYLFPLAVQVGMVFGVHAIPDDIYRAMPEEQVARSLCCVISRTDIKKAVSGINWDAILIIVKKYPIVKINCDLDFSNNLFGVRRIHFWTNKLMKYTTSEDLKTNRYFSPQILLQMLENYKLLERIQ
jgi:hypothetical protein